MKELSVIEMDDVSGAYSWNFTDPLSFFGNLAANAVELVASATLGASIGATGGAYVGGRHGGDGGGLLGLGIIAEGVGLIAGGILGGISGGIYGATTGWDNTNELFDKIIDGFTNGTLV
ncbi:hypothetical protein [Kalamiella sp. sgz302252]|uniref:hypothetical protein n=1 Tax=Pantoea sp. sgz302252 TaxID=3341827 RepID=UPI0036D33142